MVYNTVYGTAVDTEQYSIYSTKYIMSEKYSNAIVLDVKFYLPEYNAYRRLKLLQLSDILGADARYRNLSHGDQTDMICRIEMSCHDKATRDIVKYCQDAVWDNRLFINVYNGICGMLMQNMDPTSDVNSTYLIDQVLAHKIDLDSIANLKTDEMCPEKSEKIKKKLEEQSKVSFSVKTSTMYRCGKCKRNECVLERMQTRSLDELTNHRATCMFCQHTWMI